MHGEGTFTSNKSGDIYKGLFVKNLKHGKGKLTSLGKNFEISYENNY